MKELHCMSDPTALETAALVRERLFANDRASKAMGMVVLQVLPGQATLGMAVREDMLNGHATCHGGLIATLADSAFAFACNSYNQMTVASGFSIEFVAPARLGDQLTACCTERSKAGRTGVYDVEVINQHGQQIAVFRGRSHTFANKPAVEQAGA
jgi:acyl-CoA thioesterase